MCLCCLLLLVFLPVCGLAYMGMSSAKSSSVKLFWPHSILKLASSIALFIKKSMKMRKRKGKRMNEHGSCMYVAFLNASRAFDGVNIAMLCSKLLKRDVPKWRIKVIAQCSGITINPSV